MASYVFLKAIRKLPGTVIKLVPLPEPQVTEGFECRRQIGDLCRAKGYKSVLLVTDTTVFDLGYPMLICDSLEDRGIRVAVFKDISSEPCPSIIEAGIRSALDCQAECIVALGGGSVLDSCKMIAAGARLRPRNVSSLLRKFLFVRGKTLPLIMVPSTAGTGAENTVGAVVTKDSGAKCSTVLVGLDVTDVFLDSSLTVRTPASVTASCGIDALSHGLEGCVADVRVSEADEQKSRECVRLVLQNLPRVLTDPQDIEARQAMCRAANYGGNAINKQLAGYVHAFAHSVGALYHIPHGHAIALCILPVMEYQMNACAAKLAELSVHCGLAGADEPPTDAARKLLAAIARLIQDAGLSLRHDIGRDDYPELARRISNDAINYSAPVVMRKADIYAVLDLICKGR